MIVYYYQSKFSLKYYSYRTVRASIGVIIDILLSAPYISAYILLYFS